MLALVEEATRRSGLVWVRPLSGGAARPVWHGWHDGACWLVLGGAEQPAPWVATRGPDPGGRIEPPLPTGPVVVLVRSRARQGDRLLQWVADVEAVPPGSPRWEAGVRVLHESRLNAPDGQEQPRRWARESLVVRLLPTGELLAVDDGPHLAPPA